MNHADSSSGDLFRILEKAKEMKGQQAQYTGSEHFVIKIFVEEKKDIEHIPKFHIKWRKIFNATMFYLEIAIC